MKVKTKKKLTSAAFRAARTFTQAFVAFLTASPVLDLDVSTLQSAAAAGLATLIALLNRALDDSGVPTIPPG